MIEQYKSVFTKETMSNFPNMGTSHYSSMPDIHIKEEGVKKLLLKLNINKAAGPNKIVPRLLKDLAQELAPILQIIFQKSSLIM